VALNDIVFDHNTNPAYIHTPTKTRDWLIYQQSQRRNLHGYQVRLGDTMTFVSIAAYLNMNHEKRERQRHE
jgi:hypothetical protein